MTDNSFSEATLISFEKPPRNLRCRAEIRVPLLQTNKTWLAIINRKVKLHQDWQLEPVDSPEEFLAIVAEPNHTFGIVEVNPFDSGSDAGCEQLEIVLRITRQFSRQRPFCKQVAIVGQREFDQDKSTSRQLTAHLLSLSHIFRTAGALGSFWHSTDARKLIELINRFAKALPSKPLSIQDYIAANLPWQKFARPVLNENPHHYSPDRLRIATGTTNRIKKSRKEN